MRPNRPMSRGLLAALAVTLAVPAATLLGCSGSAEQPKPGPQTTTSQAKAGPQTTTIQVSYDELLNQKQISRSATLTVGDYLQISLGSNASTGYQWDEKLLISDPKVLAQTGHEVIAPTGGQPGAPGSEVWMVQAMAPGNSTVSAAYGQPWEGGEKGEWVFSVNVTVE